MSEELMGTGLGGILLFSDPCTRPVYWCSALLDRLLTLVVGAPPRLWSLHAPRAEVPNRWLRCRHCSETTFLLINVSSVDVVTDAQKKVFLFWFLLFIKGQNVPISCSCCHVESSLANQTLDKYIKSNGRQARIWVNGCFILFFASHLFSTNRVAGDVQTCVTWNWSIL